MKFSLPLLLLFPHFCFSQVQKEFYQSDSIIIKSSLLESGVIDINWIKDNFWVRFDNWKKDRIDIELSSPRFSYSFFTKDSSMLTETGPLYAVSSGFLLPKYSGRSNFVFFDTVNNKISFETLKTNTKKYILYPNTHGFLRNSFYYSESKIIFNRSSISIYVKNENQLSRSLKRVYNREHPFVSHDLNSKEEVFFGGYPDVYRNRNFLLANDDYFFSVDPEEKYMYVSFQASDDIEKYDLANYQKTLFSNVSGKYIDSDKLLAEYNSPRDYINKDFLNLLADSYGPIYPFSNVVIRIYRKGYSQTELKDLWPPDDINLCLNPAIKVKWLKKRLNKKMYIQQFDLNGNFMFEAKVPSNVNTFIGYDIAKEEYYFWEKTTHGNQGRAVIHVFKTRSI